MISVISLLDEEKNKTDATCVISSTKYAIVREIEALLTCIYKNRPNDFIEAMERIIDAENNTSN